MKVTRTPRLPRRIREFRYLKQALVVAGLILLFLLVNGIVRTFQKPGHMDVLESQSMEMTIQPPEGAMPVETETVESGPFASSVTYTGSAIAYNDMPIFPRAEGWIVSMPVYPGDRVRKGQVLVQLDSRELASRVREAEFGRRAAAQGVYAAQSNIAQAGAQAQRAQQAIQAARANLTYWQNQIQRSQALVQDEVITREEFQRDQSQFEAAQSQYNQALAELNATQQGAQSARFQAQSQQAQAGQAAANVQTQRIIQGYTTITALNGGVVTERLVSPGVLVNPNMQILRVAQINPIRIQAQVAEGDLGQIRVGNPVRIWDKKGKNTTAVNAKVTAVFPAANLQTRTATVEAIIDNSGERFIPGDYVVMDIMTGERSDVLTVPNMALIDSGAQKAVWTVLDGKAHLNYVTTGARNAQRTEIVDGLEAGDVVIVRGQTDLAEGVAVSPGKYGPEGLKALPEISSSNRLAKSNDYRITRPLEHYTVSVELSPKPPKVGKNQMMIRLSSAHGMNVSNISAELTTHMPAMASMPATKPQVRKTGDGQFTADVFFSMAGLWQTTLTIKEGGRTLGTIPIEALVGQ